MRDRLHKFLALLLSVMMLFSSLPVTALADIVKDASEAGQFFSIAISPNTDKYITYTFKYEDGASAGADQIVKNGDTLYEPEVKSVDGQKFVGWYNGGTPFTGFGVQSGITATTSVTLTAKYQAVRYVFFMDAAKGTENIRVFKTKEGTAGATVSTTDVSLPVDVTQEVTDWRNDAGEVVGPSYELPDGDSYLYPVIEDGRWITFKAEDDATYTAPQFVAVSGTSKQPTPPTRAGYKFRAWQLNGRDYTFGQKLSTDITLQATWTPITVNYTVNYWKENADWNNTFISASQRPSTQYSFIGSIKKSGTTEAKTAAEGTLPSSLQWGDDEAAGGFKVQTIVQQTIKGDGSTVVDVYFNRISYIIHFYNWDGLQEFNSNSGNITTVYNANTGEKKTTTNKDLRITAKYNAQIYPKWPQNPFTKTWVWNEAPKQWKADALIQRMPLGGQNFYARPIRNYTVKFQYYLQALDGSYPMAKESSFSYTQTTSGTGEEDIQEFLGFTFNRSKSTPIGQDFGTGNTPVKFYYDRNSYTITYRNLNNNATDSRTFKYEQSISTGNLTPSDAQTPRTPQGHKKTFVGWYADENLTKPFNFNGTMPAYSFIVYAKWEEPEVKATVHVHALSDGMHDHSQNGEHTTNPDKLKYGMSLKEAGYDNNTWLFSPEKVYEAAGIQPEDYEDYTWYGWVKKDGSPFSFDEQIFTDLDIFPSYAATGPFTLTYDVNTGSGTAPVDSHKYRGASAADVADGNGMTPPAGKVFLGWSENPNAGTTSSAGLLQPGDKVTIAKDTTLYAIWGDIPTDTTLTYHSNYPAAVLESMGGMQREHNEGVSPNNTLVTLKDNTATGFDAPTGYTFLGWSTTTDDTVEFNPGESARIDNKGENHLYAVWQRDTGTLVIVKRVKDEYKTFKGDTFTFTINGPKDYAGAPEVSHEVNIIDTDVVISTQTVVTGDYTVTEPAMDRYYTKQSVQQVTVTKNGTATVTFVNEFKAGHLTVVKTAAEPTTGLELGHVVTYTIMVTNDGNVDLHDVTVTDPNTGLNEPIGNMAVDEVKTYTTTHTITDADIMAGSFVNTATATGKDPHENPVNGQDDENVTPVAPNPGIEVVKTADKTEGLTLDEVVTYTITVTNTGNVTLYDVKVTDEKLNENWTIDSIGPGKSQSLTSTYTITQADVDAGQVYNVATASAPDPTDPEKPPVKDDDDETVTTVWNPGLILTKTATIIHNDSKWCTAEGADPNTAHLGDVIQYAFKVENTGNVTLHDVEIKDDKLGKTFTIEGTLAPGATVTYTGEDTKYTVTEDDINANYVTNTATATGTAPNDKKVTAEDTETVPTDEQKPEMTSEKTLTNGKNEDGSERKFKANEIAEFDIVVTNSGNVTLHHVTVTEEKTPGATIVEGVGYTVENNVAKVAELAPGASVTVKATYKVTQADIDSDAELKNIATADSDETEPQDPDEPIPEEDKNPAMTTEKRLTNLDKATGEIKDENGNVIGKGFKAGEIAEFDIVVTNSGNVTLHNVTVTEELTPGATIVEGAGYTVENGVAKVAELAPGASVTVKATYKVTQADIDSDAELKNIATVDSDETEPQDPDEPIPEEDKNPAMTTEKTLTNKGKGVDKDGNPNGKFTAGETAKFDIKVTNSGNVTLHNVTVTEEKTPGATIVEGTGYTVENNVAKVAELAPGATVTVQAEYTVSQADVDAGKQLTNIATVDSDETEPQNPEEPFDPDDRKPALDVVKTATMVNGEPYTDGMKVKLGDRITYRITVTNTGNVTLYDVRIDDDKVNEHWLVGTLKPGESYDDYVNYTVTQADMDDVDGFVNNVAKASAPDPTDPENPPVEDEDEEKVPTDQKPGLTIVKTFTKVTHQDGCRHKEALLAHIGDTLNYTITVTNNGNMTLTKVEVEDNTALPDVEIVEGEGYEVIDGKAVIATMAPEAVVTVNATYVVKDTDAGTKLHNVATATAPDPTNPDDPDDKITDEDDEDVEIPKIEAVKTLTNSGSGENGAFKAGETAEFDITVTNTGNTTQTNVTVSEMPGATIVAGEGYEIVDGIAVIESMAPGAKVVVKAIYTVTQADIDNGVQLENIATLDGDNPDEPEPVPVPEEEKHPGVKAVKTLVNEGTGEDGKFKANDVALFTVTVENTGNTTQTKVTVDEALENATFLATYDVDFTAMNANSGIDRNEITVTVSETGVEIENMPPQVKVTLYAQYTVTQDDIDDNKVLQNIVTLTGDNPDEPDPEPVPEDLRVGLEVIKTAVEIREIENPDRKDGTAVGDTIVYTIAVKNTGTMTLTAVQVDDILAGVKFVAGDDYTVNEDGTATIATLAPDETVTLTAEYAVTQEDIDAGSVYNKATATADDPRDDHPDEEVTDDDDETVELDKKPAMETEKTLTNEGTGTDAEGNPNGSFKAGETALFDITVTNTGNVTLTNVTVTEMDGAAIVANGDAYDIEDGAAIIPAIAPGETVTVKAAYTVTQADIDDGEELVNIATVKPEEIPDPEEPDEPIPEDEGKGHLTVTKVTTSVPANGEGYVLGETITYSLTVTNDGNLTIEDVVLLDELTGLTYEIGTLAPGETSEAVTTEYVVTEADVLAGSVLNVATATGTSPDPDEPDVPVDPGETEDPTDDPNPVFTLLKTVTNLPEVGVYNEGETILYNIRVENTGNVTLRNMVITDVLPGVVIEAGEGYAVEGNLITIAALEPGQAVDVAASYTVTNADLSGQVTNTVTATADGPDEENPDENKPEDQTSTVTVPTAERTYTLTVHYRYLDGTEAFVDYVQGDMLAGTEYNVVSPTLAGYTVNPEVVTGVMPPMNWEVTVFYVPIPAPPAPAGPNLVIIDEYGVPLNIGNVVMNVGDCFE